MDYNDLIQESGRLNVRYEILTFIPHVLKKKSSLIEKLLSQKMKISNKPKI